MLLTFTLVVGIKLIINYELQAVSLVHFSELALFSLLQGVVP